MQTKNKKEANELQYKGNAFLRLMKYLKPYKKTVALCCVLVLFLTAFDVLRPRIIGDAIDLYITQDSAQELAPDVRFQGVYSPFAWNSLRPRFRDYRVLVFLQLRDFPCAGACGVTQAHRFGRIRVKPLQPLQVCGVLALKGGNVSRRVLDFAADFAFKREAVDVRRQFFGVPDFHFHAYPLQANFALLTSER